MSRKVLSVLLATAMTASLLVGCGGTAAAPAADAAPAATEEAAPADEAPAAEEAAPAAEAGGTKVGVAMPTKDLQRWNQDGSNMEEQLKAAG
ncbi:MAG: sugar ABC transporter substrate-binding protein, partial [Lachnospiraceae bacterium]|nr:sugar ABC transporter substrate-binding protein [Lachnospiraceae bacterium]